MIVDIGGFAFFLALPRRCHPGVFAVAFGAVLAFAVLVMLVVSTSCGDHVSTDPGPAIGSTPLTTVCAPFCIAATTTAELPLTG
ncbi:hypothetical protein [Nocardia sp. NBC_00511]|uniref:hypothetical protein n=1 Tax=Nocardia sp. NBC_00511 TaxID=2903591 RepID=UPI0030E2405D